MEVKREAHKPTRPKKTERSRMMRTTTRGVIFLVLSGVYFAAQNPLTDWATQRQAAMKVGQKITINVEPALISGKSMLPWREARETSPGNHASRPASLAATYNKQEAEVTELRTNVLTGVVDVFVKFSDGTFAVTSGNGDPRRQGNLINAWDRAFTSKEKEEREAAARAQVAAEAAARAQVAAEAAAR